MNRIVLTAVFCLTTSFATAGTPTPADNTVSVLTSATTAQATAPTAVAQPTQVVVADAPACCETAKEVRLTQWQSRRLSRQADRQEARDARDCCNCNCGSKKDCRTKALVLTKSRPACNCN